MGEAGFEEGGVCGFGAGFGFGSAGVCGGGVEISSFEEAKPLLWEGLDDVVPAAKAWIGLPGRKRDRKRAANKVQSSFFRPFIVILHYTAGSGLIESTQCASGFYTGIKAADPAKSGAAPPNCAFSFSFRVIISIFSYQCKVKSGFLPVIS